MSRALMMFRGDDAPVGGVARAIAVATVSVTLLCAGTGQAGAQVQQQATGAAKQAAQQAGTPAAQAAQAAQQGAQQQAPPKPLPRIQPGSSNRQAATLPGDIPATHTIERGETLWGIAQRYLNDPYLWPEIYRLNTDVVEDPRWIYPGEILRLPGAVPAQVGAMTVNTPDAPPVTAVPVQQEESAPQGATIFSEMRTTSGTATRADMVGRVTATVRKGEYTSAPFAAAKGGPAWSGRIAEPTGTQGIAFTLGDRSIQIQERVTIVPPSGPPPQPGTEYLVIRHGPEIEGLGEAVIPTGVVRVISYERGKSVVARVTSIFETVNSGMGLIPVERRTTDSLAHPMPVADGPMSSVVYVHNRPAIPTLQAFVIIGTKGLGAVRPGDIFSLVRPVERTKDGASTPEEIIATAQVVKVTPQGATAVLSTQKSGVIKEGTPVRLSARMPAS